MSKSKKGFSLFWIIFAVFALIYIGFWVWFVNAVIVKDLKIFEASQSYHVMDELVAKIQSGDISDMNFADSSSRFEDGNVYRDSFLANLTGKTITYEESSTSYDTQAPVYEVYADGEHIATVDIVATSSKQLMFILSLQTWEIESITPIYETGDEGLVVRIPNTFTAYVNGIQLEDSELTGNTEEYSEFEFVKEYVDVPYQVEYAVEGLMTQPSVKICDADGNEVAYTLDGSTYTADYVSTSEISDEMAEYVLNNAKTYSNFFSRDLAGCDNSIKGISYMFPEDSDYLTLAENYRLHDMWMYSGHATPVFSDEAVSNYISYSDDFFKVDIYFKKSMYLTRTGDTRVDETHRTDYYVNIDGSWVIADMRDILDEDAQ